MPFKKAMDIKHSVRKRISSVKGFKYNDITHTYTIDGIKLLSSTTWIGGYKKPFDKIFASNRTAQSKKKGSRLSNPKLVREYWTSYGKRAASLGTAGHEFCRQYYLDPESTKPLVSLEHNAKKLMDALMEKYDVIEMERPRGIRRYMMGYTIDLVLKDKKTGKLYVCDFKFGGNFTPEQYKEDKNRTANLMLAPFRTLKLRDVAYHAGSIQMSMYKHFYEIQNDVKITDCILFHIDGIKHHYGEKGYKAYRYVRDVNPIVLEELKKQVVTNKNSLVSIIN